MFYEFQTTTHGKWILSGEHAVLRGHEALVFPIKEKKLTLDFHFSPTDLSAHYEGESGEDMHLLFWSVLEHGQQLLGKSLNQISGHFHLYSDIPLGVGMGASAALCVAVARWFSAQQLITADTVFSFAQHLEHLFHGKSSGLDLIGVAAETGNYFQQGKARPITQAWQPHWFLSSCGQIGLTSHCIKQVQDLWNTDKIYAENIDLKMKDSTKKAQLALESYNNTSLKNLTEAIHTAGLCFKEWGLISENLEQHMQSLLQAGALAVKPTGSGGGGYVVSLWEDSPIISSQELRLIPI